MQITLSALLCLDIVNKNGNNMGYAQHHEEEILDKYLGDVVNGTYVDIGAGHATDISNTYGLYLKGWTGLTIDPKRFHVYPATFVPSNPVQDKVKHGEPLSASHKKMRPNDIHLTIAVTNYDGEVDMCDSATLGSWLGDDYTAEGSPVIKKYGINKVKCLTINTLISKYPQFANPDFLSLDVETNEAKVLECCDFEKFTPTLMIIENEVRGIDLRANWIHFIDPYYDLVETIPGNLVFLRKK